MWRLRRLSEVFLAKDPAVARAQNAAWLPKRQWLARHAGLCADARANASTQLLFVGDSITDGWREEENYDIFKEAFGRYRPLNIGIGGDETQHVLWRLEHGAVEGLSPRVTVLLLGTNNIGNSGMTGEETARGMKAVLRTLREKLPGTKIILLAVFPRDAVPQTPMRREIAILNRRLADFKEDDRVVFYDLTAVFLSPDETLSPHLFPDMLHLSPAAYALWAEALAPIVDEQMK
jgi:beta-glucosidase